ncbi:helix-turn-helix transcriptional regulator [Schaalia suimastitidis]|uniref:helix-turn-helix transcriptional regulator n=1 Tax=Schaalia suimastitidis TaxID=121163 RepID=UPI0003F9446A|nr:WYL domain-containing protein [Schaalia suimastitidis]
MSAAVSSNQRVLDLFFALLGTRRGKTKSELAALPGYRDLDEHNFEAQFERDKDTLRTIGATLEVIGASHRYRIAEASFPHGMDSLDDTDKALINMAAHAWQGNDLSLITPKLAATTSSPLTRHTMPFNLDLEGADVVADLAQAIMQRRVVAFTYSSLSGSAERAVEPWRLIIRFGRLYLWGFDLDRYDQRLFRLSRVTSAVEYLGDSADAAPMPEGLPDPFDALTVAPLLLIRHDAAAYLAAYTQRVAAPREAPDGWHYYQGHAGEYGTWMTRILRKASSVVVIEPALLRAQILDRLRSATEVPHA